MCHHVDDDDDDDVLHNVQKILHWIQFLCVQQQQHTVSIRLLPPFFPVNNCVTWMNYCWSRCNSLFKVTIEWRWNWNQCQLARCQIENSRSQFNPSTLTPSSRSWCTISILWKIVKRGEFNKNCNWIFFIIRFISNFIIWLIHVHSVHMPAPSTSCCWKFNNF